MFSLLVKTYSALTTGGTELESLEFEISEYLCQGHGHGCTNVSSPVMAGIQHMHNCTVLLMKVITV